MKRLDPQALEGFVDEVHQQGNFVEEAHLLVTRLEHKAAAKHAEPTKQRHRLIGDVRAEVRDQIKLAEMYWRYKVVGQEQDPKTMALTTLRAAKDIADDWASGRRERQEALRAEYAQISQGIGFAQLIHTPADEIGDRLLADIRFQLEEALKLRKQCADWLGCAESYNSLGSLYAKVGKYRLAEANFVRSLKLRQEHAPKDLAQSCVSLGQLMLEFAALHGDEGPGGGGSSGSLGGAAGAPAAADGGDAGSVDGGGSGAGGTRSRAEALEKAEEYLQRALLSYEETLGPDNAHVANAHEGLVRVFMQQGRLELASTHLELSLIHI